MTCSAPTPIRFCSGGDGNDKLSAYDNSTLDGGDGDDTSQRL